jgi:4-hydroxybutyrate CoA-transferase
LKRTSPAKQVSAREAIRALPPSCRALFSAACGAPLSLIEAIDQERDHFENLQLYSGLVFFDSPLFSHLSENVHLTTWHVAGPLQKLVAEGTVAYLPQRLSEVPLTFGRNGQIPVDAALVQTSPPDERGYVSLGVTVSSAIDVAREAPIVIAEVNQQTPYTMGNSLLHVDEIDYLVDADYPLIQHRETKEPGEVEKAVAGHIAGLIPDGATLQIGIGAVPEALMFSLDDKRDLGVHSGLITDGFARLMEMGVVTNKRKSIDVGKSVGAEAMGSLDFYRYLHKNPLFHFDSVRYTHRLDILTQIEGLISINSALEVDLTGQVSSENLGGRQLSGLGGQFDFIEGVLHGKGGISIVALPSTALRGSRSRLVAGLEPGSVVTTPRFCAEYVVTEHGVAGLKGKTVRERAQAMIAIAHPDFRDSLASQSGL